MKKYVIAAIMIAVSAIAFALPSTTDVANAVHSGNYVAAENMLNEVMKEHPNAKVHYLLGQVLAKENRHRDALNELRQAQTLDPTLHFASSALAFTNILNDEQAIVDSQNHVVSPPILAHTANTSTGTDFGKFFIAILILLFLSGLAFILYSVFSSKKEQNSVKKQHESDAKEQLSIFLDLSARLSDADLINKTGSFDDVTKALISGRIKTLNNMVVNFITDAKRSMIISDSRLHEIKQNCDEIVESANTGVYQSSIPKVQESSASQEVHEDVYNWKMQRAISRTPLPPRSQQPSNIPVVTAQPTTVVVNNSNNGFVEGMIVADLLNEDRHHETIIEREVVEKPVYVTTTDDHEVDTRRSNKSSWDDTPTFDTGRDSSSDSGSSSSDSWSSSDNSGSSFDSGSSSNNDW